MNRRDQRVNRLESTVNPLPSAISNTVAGCIASPMMTSHVH